MAASAKRERQVAAFDEGELWCSDEADPPLNPAGWYFRAARGSPAHWIGPFADEDEAAVAPFSGDALRDARRYLDLWKRGEPAPRPRLALVEPMPASVPELDPAPGATLRPEPAPPPDPTPAPQFELTLPGAGAAPARRRGRRGPAASPAAAQLALDLP